MKKKDRQIKEHNPIQDIAVVSNASQKISIDAPNIIYWLLGSILFFLLASQVVPVYLLEFDSVSRGSGYFKTIFGIVGIITYFVEPLMMVVYKPVENEGNSAELTSYKEEGLKAKIVNGIMYVALWGPILMLAFIKPLFRTFLLMISFSLLHLPGPESALFVMIALPDILLYFITLGFSEWRNSPAKIAVRFLRIKESKLLLHLGAIFYTLYTAFVYSFWLKLGYTDSGNVSTEDDLLIVLLLCWFLANLYIRMPFFSYKIDVISFFKNIPWPLLLLQIAILLISFFAYMWPFLF